MQKQFHKALDRLGHTIAAGVDFDDEGNSGGFAVTVTLMRVTPSDKPGVPDAHHVLSAAEARFRVLDA